MPLLLLLIIPFGLGVYYCIWYARLLSKCVKTLKTVEISNYIVSLETLATEQAKLIRAQEIVLLSSAVMSILTLLGIVVSGASFFGGLSNSDSPSSSINKDYSNSTNSTRSNNSTSSSNLDNSYDPSPNSSNTDNGSNIPSSTANSTSISQPNSNSTNSSINPNPSSTSDNTSSSYTNSSSSTIINFN